MNTTCAVIDDLGEVWETDLVRERFSDKTRSFLPHILRLGFITLKLSDEQRMVVRLDSRAVKQQAIAGLMYFLADYGPEKVALQVDLADGVTEATLLDKGRLHTIGAINDILKSVCENPDLRVNCTRMELGELHPRSPLKRTLDLWSNQQKDIRLGRLKTALKRAADDRYLVMDRSESGAFCIADFGDSQPDYIVNWLHKHRGRPISLHPDKDYAFLSEVAYMRALRTNQPLLDEVQAKVQPTRRKAVQRHYRRLLLPIVDRAREGVLSITEEVIAA